MAIWHLRAQVIGRSSGKSAVGAAAYRAGQALFSEHAEVTFDYTNKHGIAFNEILAPAHAPAWVFEREQLWNAVERFEKRKDATLAREIEVALPTELTVEQNKSLLREYLQENFVKLNMIADYAIHDVDGYNPHAHIMLTLRPIDEKGFGKKAREWNDKALFETWREQWAALTNKHLALAGFDKKIDQRSYVAQGIDLEPTIHRGYLSEKNSAVLDRLQQAKAIEERNLDRLLANPQIALDLLTHHESVFSHQDLARFVNERTHTVEDFNRLKLAIETHTHLVHLGAGQDGKTYYTSRHVLEREADLIKTAQRLSISYQHQLNPKRFDFVLATRTLNEEQQAAFEHILSSGDLSLIVGFAGTGKSYLMDAVREAYESQGYRVIGTALSGRASDGLAQSAHINSRTIARFLLDWEHGRYQLDNKTVLIIDEIGMVGTRQLQALLAEAKRAGAKVIGCGDPEQIPPVEAGCPFRYLLERISHVFLKNVVRQKVNWQREATVELSTQQHAKALDRYQSHGHIHEHETREMAMENLVERWQAYRQISPAKSAVMMAYRNVDVLALNLMARERLLAKDKLDTVKALSVNTQRFGQLAFAVNDRLLFLQNDNDLKVKNGLMGTIQAINGTVLTVALDRGDTVAFDSQRYNQISYGYAATVHKLQGETVDKAFVLATPHLDRFLTNVAMDRHREDVELHYGDDDFASYHNLKRTLSRGESKVLAVEFAQARGIDYDLTQDVAATVESKTNFHTYWKDILAEQQGLPGTLGETYLRDCCGVQETAFKSLYFHPAVWERETQSHMPALVARSVGLNEKGELADQGVQITFLDSTTGERAALQQPIRYTGKALHTVIPIQKAALPEDKRYFMTFDIESAVSIANAQPDIRVVALAHQEELAKIPLKGQGNRLTLCVNHTSPAAKVEAAIAAFKQKGFEVYVAQPEMAANFAALYKAEGALAVQATLAKALPAQDVKNTTLAVENVLQQFAKLDAAFEKANAQPYYAYQVVAREAIERYALEVGRNKPLYQQVQQKAPALGKRIEQALAQEQEISL